jgi:Fe2+ transport system protein FeoA
MAAGQKGRVARLLDQGELYQRLLEMGLTQGTPVEMVRFAPLGDPIDIKIRGYHLSLRRQEAEVIEVIVEGHSINHR